MEERNTRKETTADDAFSAEARAEAVAKFAEAMNQENIDGFIFGVSFKEGGGIASAACGTKATLTYVMSSIFAESKLDPDAFIECALLHALSIMMGRKEAGND